MGEQEPRFEFRGTLTEEQFRRIQRVGSRKVVLGVGAFFLAIMAMNLASGGLHVIAGDPVIQLARLSPFVVFPILLFIMPRWQARRQYRATPALRSEVRGMLTESGV